MSNRSLDILLLLVISIIALSGFYGQYLDTYTYYAVAIGMRIIYIGLFVVYNKRRRLSSINVRVKPNIKDLIFLPTLIIAGSNFISLFFVPHLIVEPQVDLAFYLELILIILSVIIEEFIYRAMFLNGLLLNRFSRKKAILISALIFGLIHLVNINILAPLPTLIQVGYSFLLGLILALVYVAGGRISYPIIIHLAFNVINSFFFGNMVYLELNIWYYVVNVLVGVIALAYTMIAYRIRQKEKGLFY